MPTDVARKGIREAPALYRQPLRVWGAADFTGDQWRFLVVQAPIVRSCVTTIVMYLNAMEWFLESDDQDAIAYYTNVLETADEGAGWNVWTARLIDDCLTMPFGGVAEMGIAGDTVVWTAHLDAATMRPTGLRDFPYGQLDPWGSREPVPFRAEQIGRVRWMPETRVKQYDWTRPPVGDAIPAITALVRADRFWQSLLLDTPPAGILDLIDMTEKEATDWYESWKQLLAGQDGFKVPVLYGGSGERKTPAAFIRFNSSPLDIQMMDILKNYAEQVTACFGLSLGDLGLFGQELRLAGATKLMDLTKRQGPANVMRALKVMIDLDILPDGVTFQWREIDTEDSLRKGQARLQSATALATLTQAGLISNRLAELSAEVLDIVPQEAVDAYNAELEGQGAPEDAAEIAPPDSTPTGDQRAAMTEHSKWSRKMKAVADRILAPSRQGFTKTRIKALIQTGLAAYGEKRTVGRSRESAEAALAKRLAKEGWWKAPNLADEVFGILQGAYEDGIRGAIKEAGGNVKPATVNLTNKAVLTQLEDHAGEFITQIDEGTRNMVARHVMAGVERGVSSPDIVDSIANDVRGILLDAWKGRTDSIVNTEISQAETQAALQEYQELGLSKKRWHAVPGLACEICLSNDDAGEVDMDYQFETVFGDADGPPGHPNVCHCYVTFSKAELKKLGRNPNWWLGGDTTTPLTAVDIHDVAEVYEPEIKSAMKGMAGDNEMEMVGLKFDLKSVESIEGKIARKGGDSDAVHDALRFTATAPAEDYTKATSGFLSDLEKKGYRIDPILSENHWARTDYHGVNTIMETPDGYSFELQFHTPESFATKEANHILYEKARVLPQGAERAAIEDEMAAAWLDVPVPPEVKTLLK